jgi:hypothetical protein
MSVGCWACALFFLNPLTRKSVSIRSNEFGGQAVGPLWPQLLLFNLLFMIVQTSYDQRTLSCWKMTMVMFLLQLWYEELFSYVEVVTWGTLQLYWGCDMRNWSTILRLWHEELFNYFEVVTWGTVQLCWGCDMRNCSTMLRYGLKHTVSLAE